MGHSREYGRIMGLYWAYGLERTLEGKSCETCFWYSEEYPARFCLKWNMKKRSNDVCPYWTRRVRAKKSIFVGFPQEPYILVASKTLSHMRQRRFKRKLQKLIEEFYRKQRYYEEYSYVLGNTGEGILQVIGEKYFTLLKVKTNEGVKIHRSERVYIGREKERRKKVRMVLKKISYSDLTSENKEILPNILDHIIWFNEERFVQAFNEAGYITPQLHSLLLLAGITRSKLETILAEREKSPFRNFLDIEIRTNINPVMSIRNRILAELKGGAKYRLFVKSLNSSV